MKKILLIVALLMCNAAFASDGWRWMAVTDSMAKSSQADACNDGKGYGTIPSGWTYTGVVNSNGDQATCNWNNHGNYYGIVGRVACADPMVITNGVCALPPPVCTPGREFSVTVTQGFKIPGSNKTTDMKAPSNVGGCRVYPGSIEECMSAPSGEVFCTWRVTEGGIAATGESASSNSTLPSGSTPTTVPEYNPALGAGCPKGTVNLGIDSAGGSICGGSGTSPSTPTKTEVTRPTTTATNPDGGNTKTESIDRTNSDGSVTTTTTTTTTAADGTVTKKVEAVTSGKPGGGGGSSDSEGDDFCKKHPELNACKNSEVTAGTCAAGADSTACTGDAIQCAILRQQKKEYCEWNKENPSATLGNQAVAGNDPLKSTLPTKENASQFNMQSLDQSGFLGGGSCFQDKSVTVQGIAINLPFSKLCPYLEWLRYVIMIIAALVSLRIVSKPVLGD